MNPSIQPSGGGGLTPEDTARINFLVRLDHAPFEVTHWEALFIETFLTDPRPMTPSQRQACDNMRHRYEAQL